MRFLVDAQLPLRLTRALAEAGHDVTHTLDLPEGNRSTDRVVAAACDAERRVLVTKDHDFRDSHLLRGSPRRLLLVTTGNIGNDQLLELFLANLRVVVSAFDSARMVELGPGGVEVFEGPSS